MSSKQTADVSETETVPLLYPLAMEFLLPLAVVLALDYWLVVPLTQSGQIPLLWGIVLVVGPKLLVMPWAASRLLRLTENHFRRFGLGGIKLALLGGLLLAVLVVILSAFESVQTMVFSRHESVDPAAGSAPDYRFTLDEDSGQYAIQGTIDFGISRDFREFIARHPGGKVLVLQSQGGSIYEGRGLFQIATTHRV